MACIGNCLAGPNAISHDFFNFSVSVSSCVGGFLVALSDFLPVPVLEDVYPGGSEMFDAFFCRDGGGLLSSTAHFGGGGMLPFGIFIKAWSQVVFKVRGVLQCEVQQSE